MTTPQEILRQYFGYSTFRPLQQEAINTVLQGQDVLLLMPTGGGKSLCYQIPALVSSGLCVVVSPLISLMKDQVQSLRQNGIAAAYLNSSQTPAEQQQIEQACMRGSLKLLYVSPEKLSNEWFQNTLRSLQINLFAVDEAHCISFWGHDFRPEYTQLQFLKQKFPDVPIIALTATADQLTRQDIVAQLHLPQPRVLVSSFDRPNINLAVRPAKDRVNQIVAYLKQRPKQAGIIYALSRKTCESLAEKLQNKGFAVAAYHAGMSSNERAHVQDAFLKDNLQVICATIAFGMGIDKSNVRFVLHYNLPKNIESYYQEIGRAGRDSAPADALLFYSYADYALQQEMLEDEDSKMKAIKLAKLERLQQFVEADICRRKILLNYFNEDYPNDCQHCDVCHAPRKKIDGTIIAQKALSAIARTNEQLPLPVITDLLRGVLSYRVREGNWQTIKTFGAGRNLKPREWQYFINQMINLGYINIAYDEHNALKITEKGWDILRKNEPVILTQFTEPERITAPIAPQPKEKEFFTYDEVLYEQLRQLRKQLADEQGVPPYIVFSDKTLQQMAADMPKNDTEFAAISGVGLRKLAFYGNDFLAIIRRYLKENNNINTSSHRSTHDNAAPQPKIPTTITTLAMLQGGDSPETIAQKRELTLATIYGHIAKLYESGKLADISPYITEAQIAAIGAAIRTTKEVQKASVIREFLQQQYEYGVIQIGMAYWRKNNT